MDTRLACLIVVAIVIFVFILIADAGADGHQ
jgi:hypothetical protein